MNKDLLKKLIVPIFANSSSSSDDSSSDEDEISNLSDVEIALKFYKKPLRKRNCIRNYFEEVVPTYTAEEFRTHFRINRELFKSLCERFEASQDFVNLREDKRNSAFKHLAVFLWFAGHEACSYRDISDRFGISLWTVEKIIERVTYFLSGLADEIIKWPNENRKQAISNNFKEKNGFSNCAIDGTHIVIDPPKRGKDDYVSRKGSYSIVLQGICDDAAKFLDICVGFPGSVHDSRVLRNSPIYSKLETLCGGKHFYYYKELPETSMFLDYYLLGDSAYPCVKYLITPYKDNGHLTSAQKYFNRKLNSSRVIIEHTFGILKQRFRQLYYTKLRGMKKICHFVRACCVLHNLAGSDGLQTADIELEAEDPSIEIAVNTDSSSGKTLRDKLCEQMRN